MNFRTILILGALTAFGPLAIDFYLPAFPSMALAFGTDEKHVQMTLAAYFAGLAASPQAIAEVRTKLGLDKSLPEQFVAYVGDLLQGKEGAAKALQRLVLIDSRLSPIGWPEWFDLNGLPLPTRPRPSFDRAAMAIAAAVDGMGVALESTLLAAREIERGDLVVLGERSLQKIVRPVHFLSVRTVDRARAPVVAFVRWVQAQTA